MKPPAAVVILRPAQMWQTRLLNKCCGRGVFESMDIVQRPPLKLRERKAICLVKLSNRRQLLGGTCRHILFFRLPELQLIYEAV